MSFQCSITCLVREVPGLSGQQRLENTLKQFGILASIASPTEEQTTLAMLFQSNVHVVQGIVEKCVYKITDTSNIQMLFRDIQRNVYFDQGIPLKFCISGIFHVSQNLLKWHKSVSFLFVQVILLKSVWKHTILDNFGRVYILLIFYVVISMVSLPHFFEITFDDIDRWGSSGEPWNEWRWLQLPVYRHRLYHPRSSRCQSGLSLQCKLQCSIEMDVITTETQTLYLIF